MYLCVRGIGFTLTCGLIFDFGIASMVWYFFFHFIDLTLVGTNVLYRCDKESADDIKSGI